MDRNNGNILAAQVENRSLSARRAWIEIWAWGRRGTASGWSLSARRAWIEIAAVAVSAMLGSVALRKESVDRNPPVDTSSVSASVALRKESVDRNTQRRDFKRLGLLGVALRKESVDRNRG